MVGCIFWRVPRNTTTHQLSPADDSDKKVADTIVQLADDDSGNPNTNHNDELKDGQQREDSRLRSPSFFQSQQPKQ